MMAVPKRRGRRLSVAIPASLVSGMPHLREKTQAIGRVGRAAAIFRVDEIFIYRDEPDEAHLIRHILGYMETPQYLRRRLIKKRPELRYAGALPPLRTPHHPTQNKAAMLEPEEYREGVVLSSDGEMHLVDVGVEQLLTATGRAPSPGGRVTVKIVGKEPLICRVVKRGEVPHYWGFNITVSGKDPAELAAQQGIDLTIATSRKGSAYKEALPELEKRWDESRSVLVLFGSSRQGIDEILVRRGRRMEGAFDFVLNTLPEQGVETVRVDEALTASLALLNLLG